MKRLFPTVALIVTAAAIGGCGDGGGDSDSDSGSAPAAKSAVTDNIASFAFVPDPIVVAAGGKVTWTNRDKAPHTAETDPGVKGAFDTGRLDQGESKSIRFDDPGKFSYYCVYHRFMTGTVDVRK